MPRTLLCSALIAWLVSLFAPGEVRAEFGACSGDVYRDELDRRGVPRSAQFICIELLRVPFQTSDGPREMRLVRHLAEPLRPVPQELVARYEHGMRTAAAALARIGDFRSADITIFMNPEVLQSTVDDSGPEPALNNRGGPTGETASTREVNPGECMIVAFHYLATGPDYEGLAFGLAHEVFHCVQQHSLSDAQWAVPVLWWAEGSANWFAHFAVPESDEAAAVAGWFDDSVAAGMPLHQMGYEAFAFFVWYAQEFGETSIMPLLRQMSPYADAGAQVMKLASILSQEQWLDFATAYYAGEIRGYPPAQLVFAPDMGPRFKPTERMRIMGGTTPFRLMAFELEFPCGAWKIEVPEGQEIYRVRAAGTTGWQSLPPTVARVETRRVFTVVRMASSQSTSEVPFAVEMTPTESCNECLGSPQIDACVVGSWQSVSNTMSEVVQSIDKHTTVHDFAPTTLTTYRTDGTFSATTFLTLDIEDVMGDDVARTMGAASYRTEGIWSAGEGKLRTCQTVAEGSFDGIDVIMGPEGVDEVPVGQALVPTDSEVAYSCTDESFETRVEYPGAPPIVFRFGEAPSELPPPEPEPGPLVMERF